MSLAFPEFATSDTLSPFPKKILNQVLAASELLYWLRLRQPLPFNQPGRYWGGGGQVQDEGALLTSLSSLCRNLYYSDQSHYSRHKDLGLPSRSRGSLMKTVTARRPPPSAAAPRFFYLATAAFPPGAFTQ